MSGVSAGALGAALGVFIICLTPSRVGVLAAFGVFNNCLTPFKSGVLTSFFLSLLGVLALGVEESDSFLADFGVWRSSAMPAKTGDETTLDFLGVFIKVFNPDMSGVLAGLFF